jgi:hypothetical protein
VEKSRRKYVLILFLFFVIVMLLVILLNGFVQDASDLHVQRYVKACLTVKGGEKDR